MITRVPIWIVAALFMSHCHESASSQTWGQKPYETKRFKEYWYSGKAEVSSYKLRQSRYGEERTGKAVLIFVTEDFSKDKHVKLDDPSKHESDRVSVLKLNFTKQFVTGIYPYAMMESVFTPVARHDYPHSLKMTMSVQEWCGHVFTQMNLRENTFQVRSFSYFEQEGDVESDLRKVFAEDEIWNLIRLQPDALPVGEFGVIPALFFARLMHTELKVLKASAIKTDRGNEFSYVITYPETHRSIEIRFQKNFPFKILGWDEQFKEKDGSVHHTTGTLEKTLHTDYWKKNENKFQYLRDSLGLPRSY